MALFEYRVRLQAMHYGAQDIALYELKALDTVLPEVSAGSHLDLHLPNGLLRQYSLITPLCTVDRYVIAVKRQAQGRGGSAWLHDQARLGITLSISEPRNHFALQDGSGPVLLLAGGIGITPVYSMLKALRAQGRNVHLHYWCRANEQTLFAEELASAKDVSVHYSNAGTRYMLAHALTELAADTQIYCCGPKSMLDELDALADSLSVPIYTERFQADQAPVTAEQAFTVVLARSGAEVAVTPGTSILQALLDANADVMYSCEQGICGACEVKVINGAPVHCDTVRSAEEHGRRQTMMICCSSASSSRLVLDI